MKRNVNRKYKTHFLQQFIENIYIVLYHNVFFKYHIIVTMEQQKSNRNSSNLILPISKYLLCRLVVLSWIFTNLEKIWYSKDSIAIVSYIGPMKFLNSLYQLQSYKKNPCPKNYIKWCKKMTNFLLFLNPIKKHCSSLILDITRKYCGFNSCKIH